METWNLTNVSHRKTSKRLMKTTSIKNPREAFCRWWPVVTLLKLTCTIHEFLEIFIADCNFSLTYLPILHKNSPNHKLFSRFYQISESFYKIPLGQLYSAVVYFSEQKMNKTSKLGISNLNASKVNQRFLLLFY